MAPPEQPQLLKQQDQEGLEMSPFTSTIAISAPPARCDGYSDANGADDGANIKQYTAESRSRAGLASTATASSSGMTRTVATCIEDTTESSENHEAHAHPAVSNMIVFNATSFAAAPSFNSVDFRAGRSHDSHITVRSCCEAVISALGMCPLRVADFETVAKYVIAYLREANYGLHREKTPSITTASTEKLQTKAFKASDLGPPYPPHDDRLTFGLELEMVIENCQEEEGLQIMLQCLRQLYQSGGVAYDAEIQSGMQRDRSKFLVMVDHSINKDLAAGNKDDGSSWGLGGEIDSLSLEHNTFDDSFAVDDNTIPSAAIWGWGKSDSVEPFAQESLADGSETDVNNHVDENEFYDDGYESDCEADDMHVADETVPAFQEDMTAGLGAPVEICTPILGQTTYEPVIKAVFSHVSQNLALQFNESTGLHVHVGCGVGSCWSLQELKAIGSAVLLWEVVVDLMHAPHRGKGNWMISSNRWNPVLRDYTLVDALRTVLSTQTVDEFYEAVGSAKFVKVNFIANRVYGTVEFRQAEAYGDGTRAVEWIRFLSGFVSAALMTADREWLEWGEAVGTRGNQVGELLKLDEHVWERFGLPMGLRRRVEEDELANS